MRHSLRFLLLFSISIGAFAPLSAQDFRRGDTDGDGVAVTLNDLARMWGVLSLPGTALPDCMDAVDANDDGQLNVVDAVVLVEFLLGDAGPPPAPGPTTCGPDPTPDGFDCQSYSCVPTGVPEIPAVTLTVGSAVGSTGAEVSVPLLHSNAGPVVGITRGFSATVVHDPAIATIVAVDEVGLYPWGDEIREPDFRLVVIETDRWAVSILTTYLYFSALADGPVAVARYELLGSGTSPLTFSDDPIRTEVSVGAAVLGRPTLIAGSLGVDLEQPFKRGEANGDGTVNIADALFVLNALFADGAYPSCEDAADFNDDGAIDVADGVFGLGFLFVSGAEPPAPGITNCGPDPTTDALSCNESSCP